MSIKIYNHLSKNDQILKIGNVQLSAKIKENYTVRKIH